MFLLDDLLWVLTDSQLKAMMKYAESLSEAMEKSAQQRKSLAPESVQVSEAWFGRWLARKKEKTRCTRQFLFARHLAHTQSISLVRTVRLPWSASHRSWAIVE